MKKHFLNYLFHKLKTTTGQFIVLCFWLFAHIWIATHIMDFISAGWLACIFLALIIDAGIIVVIVEDFKEWKSLK